MARRSRTASPTAGSFTSCPPKRTSPKSPLCRRRSNMHRFAQSSLSTRPNPLLGFGILLSCVLFIAGFSSSAATAATLSDLKAYPPEINLTSAKARQRVVIQAGYADGLTRDVTTEASCKVADSKLVKLDKAILSPVTDGKTELRISFKGKSVTVPIAVTNAKTQAPLSFKLDVMPVFMKAGCNAGACHGSSKGKDGFRLSLFGFDPDGDYFRLTREQIGRRINLAIPQESLIVQKGLGTVQHTGGVRFATNSDLCQTLIAWLAAGAPKDPDSVAKVTGIEIFPKAAVLEGSNTIQRLIVRASYSDGSQRDVTPLAVFISNNDVSAKVAEDGVVPAGQRGEAFIQARFAEFNVVADEH